MNVEVFTPSRGTFIEVLGGGLGGGGGGFIIPPDVARKSQPNIFQQVNTFNGMRWVPKIVTSNYHVTPTDSIIFVDASAGPVIIFLSPALGEGQIYLIMKVDDTFSPVTIQPNGIDVINSDFQLILTNQWDWVEIADGALGQWGNFSRLSSLNLPTDLAYTDITNVFTAPNSFSGISVIGKIITGDYTVTDRDNILVVNADSGPLQITLPPTQPDGDPRYGAWLYFKNISTTNNMVTVATVGDDRVDGAISINFSELYSDLMLFDIAPNMWSNVFSSAASGSGTTFWGDIEGTLSDQTDLQAALDLKLNIPSPLPARPTTLNETIQVLVNGGLCAA